MEVLGPDGEADPNPPHLLGVALPVPGGGTERGFYAFPEEGTTVVVGQRLVAPKTHLGSEVVNVLQVLCNLIDLVKQMNTAIAVHKHGPPIPPPDNAGEFTAHAGAATALAGQLKPITE